jgi:putative DNA primase/helicase
MREHQDHEPRKRGGKAAKQQHARANGQDKSGSIRDKAHEFFSKKPPKDKQTTKQGQFVADRAFAMAPHGLIYRDKKKKRHWISAPFTILGYARSPQSDAWAIYIQWRDPGGILHRRQVTRADLHRDAGTLCAELSHEGLEIGPTWHRQFVQYVGSVQPKGFVTPIAKTGWHEIGDKLVFVLPDNRTFGAGDETVIFTGGRESRYKQKGKLEQWRDSVGRLAKDQDRAMLEIATALAGPLLYLASGEPGGTHEHGDSSTGKTTLMQAGASCWGRGDDGPGGFIRSWHSTANGIEAVARITIRHCFSTK